MNQAKRLVSNLVLTSRNFIKFNGQRNYNCWFCDRSLTNAERKEFFCPCETNKILPVNTSVNYFDVFTLDKHNYNIDKNLLTKNFRQLMRKLHPDLFTQSSDEEKRYSSEQSSLVNKAYKTLLNPISRGLYMLKLENIIFEREAVETGSESDSERNQLLLCVLELNEELNEIRTKTELESFENDLNTILSPLEKELEAALHNRDFGLAVAILKKMKYFGNIEEKVDELKLKFHLSEI